MSRWPLAAGDDDFAPYLTEATQDSAALFWGFIAMVRACGPAACELQRPAVVIRGSRRIFASVRVTTRGIAGILNLERRLPPDARIRRADPLTRRLFIHRYSITSGGQLDKEFGQWLGEAYAVGNGGHLSR